MEAGGAACGFPSLVGTTDGTGAGARLFVGTVIIGLAADSIGLIRLTSPDDMENLTPLLLLSQSLQSRWL